LTRGVEFCKGDDRESSFFRLVVDAWTLKVLGAGVLSMPDAEKSVVVCFAGSRTLRVLSEFALGDAALA
jgi:hypothetical protein